MICSAESRYSCVFLPICWGKKFSIFRQKTINMAVVIEQITEAFDWKLIGFIKRGRIHWNFYHNISMVCDWWIPTDFITDATKICSSIVTEARPLFYEAEYDFGHLVILWWPNLSCIAICIVTKEQIWLDFQCDFCGFMIKSIFTYMSRYLVALSNFPLIFSK